MSLKVPLRCAIERRYDGAPSARPIPRIHQQEVLPAVAVNVEKRGARSTVSGRYFLPNAPLCGGIGCPPPRYVCECGIAADGWAAGTNRQDAPGQGHKTEDRRIIVPSLASLIPVVLGSGFRGSGFRVPSSEPWNPRTPGPQNPRTPNRLWDWIQAISRDSMQPRAD